MSIPSTWLWIPETWVVLYPVVTILGFVIGHLVDPALYCVVTLVVVPLVLIPVTYRKLVCGACSLRFRICGFVKGILAGSVFLVLSVVADPAVWTSATSVIGWSPLSQTQLVSNAYWLWFFSGVLGGIGARVAEVRHGGTAPECSVTVGAFT